MFDTRGFDRQTQKSILSYAKLKVCDKPIPVPSLQGGPAHIHYSTSLGQQLAHRWNAAERRTSNKEVGVGASHSSGYHSARRSASHEDARRIDAVVSNRVVQHACNTARVSALRRASVLPSYAHPSILSCQAHAGRSP
jgi:hypothetical protein